MSVAGFTIADGFTQQTHFSTVQQLQDSSTLESQALTTSYHPSNLLHVTHSEVQTHQPWSCNTRICTQYGDIPCLTLTFQFWMFPATRVGNHCTRKPKMSHLSYVVHTKQLTASIFMVVVALFEIKKKIYYFNKLDIILTKY